MGVEEFCVGGGCEDEETAIGFPEVIRCALVERVSGGSQ